MPEVTLVAPYPPAGERHGGHSGVASYTANLAHALVEQGGDVQVIAPVLPDDPEHFDDGPVRVRRCFPLGATALPRALRAAAATDTDIVHLQWELFLYGGPASIPGLFPALAAAQLQRAPLVATMHQVVEPSEIDRRYTALHRVRVPPAVARLGVTGVQHSLRAGTSRTIVHEDRFGAVLGGASVIPHGVEQVAAPDPQTARRERDLDDRLTVLCFGFVAPYKGLEQVLDAAEIAGSGVHVVVAGGEHPRMEGEGYLESLRQRSGGTVRFTGRVPDDEVGGWFAAADVALLAYPQPFSSSGALALALAYGTPVLLSPALARCTGAPDALTISNDPLAMAAALHDLAAADDRAEQLAELRRWTTALATGRTWDVVARRHLDLYEEVLDASRTARWRLRTG